MAEEQRGSHVIRLNSAWELRLLSDLPERDVNIVQLRESMPSTARVNLPCGALDEIAVKDAAAVLLTRRFNRPSNLTPNQAVSLSIEGLLKDVAIYFNGDAVDTIPDTGTANVSIGDRLQDNNRLDLLLRDASFLTRASIRMVIPEG